ncbi:phosphatase-like protein [Xylariales sp. PMI_506]|nr:phosphatase-like protein [Xylariales sp. PMI_506]
MSATTKTIYLVLYNAVSLSCWSWLTAQALARILLPDATSAASRLPALYADLLYPLAAIQTAAFLEVLHAALGLVRASPVATGVQIGGRNLVIWTVMMAFPGVVTGSELGLWAFVGCLLAWGTSDIIRYGFFVVQLVAGRVPAAFRWLRYNAFLPLYPVGLLSEAILVYLSLTSWDTEMSSFYRGYLFLGLLAYLPAGPFLYSHMLSQRRKVMKQLAKKE